PGSIFYLKERVTVKTKTGITALEPGTGVRLVSENGNALSVTNGITTFDVPKEKLTASINEANVAAQNYYVTEQAAPQSFNSKVERQEQEQKRALEQQRIAAERQATLDAQRQAAERRGQWEAGQKQLARMQTATAEQQKVQAEYQRVQEIRAL